MTGRVNNQVYLMNAMKTQYYEEKQNIFFSNEEKIINFVQRMKENVIMTMTMTF